MNAFLAGDGITCFAVPVCEACRRLHPTAPTLGFGVLGLGR